MAFNKAATALDAAYKMIPGLPLSGGFRTIDKWHGVSGTIQKQTGGKLYIGSNGDVSLAGGGASILSKTVGQWVAQAIDAAYVGASHGKVKDSPIWAAIYGYQANTPYPFINAAGTGATLSQSTMPCHNCGIVLPVDCVQVDHHMPQANGESLYTLKVMRALDLTTAPATGGKGLGPMMAGGLASVRLAPKARARGDYDHLENPSAAAKWTTNDKGSAFLSLMVMVGAGADVERMCMNSLFNLVPLCPACNRVKSDWVKPLA